MLKLLRNRLTLRVLAMFLCVMLFEAAALSIGSMALASGIMEEQTYKAKEDTLAQMEKNMGTLTSHIISLTQMYALNLPLESALRYPTEQTHEAFKLAYNLQKRAFEYPLTAIQDSFDIIIYGVNGTLIQNEKVYMGTGTDMFTTQPWYERLLEDPDRVHWISGSGGVFPEEAEQRYFTAAQLLRNSYSRFVYGVVLMRFKESSLYSIYGEQSGANYEITVVAPGTEILSSSRRERIGERFELDPSGEMISGSFARRELDGEPYLLAGRGIQPSGLRIYALTPESEIHRYSRQMFSVVAMVAGVSFLISLVMAVGFTRSLGRPIVGLIQRIQARHSRAGPAAAGPARDDLALLATEYDVLVEELETAILQMDQARENRRVAELQMLQSQINPHFLYNTLSSIKCLVWTGRTEMIEPVTDALIHLLENTISQKQEMVTLRQDLHCVRDYLAIQRIRLCRELALVIHCEDDGLLDTRVPKLLLQPIVENCVFHGIEPTGGDGSVTISIAGREGCASILVEDDGGGISREALDRIYSPSSGMELSHIGVCNVMERVKLYYEGRGAMCIYPRQAGGTAVEITIPLEEGTECTGC